MRDFGPPWALCGGWAVDAWIGQQTREHADVDMAVFIDDQRELFDHLRGWQLIAHDPNVPEDTSELWNGRELDLPAHVHGRLPTGGTELPDSLSAPAQQGFDLDIQFDERAGDDLILRREPLVLAVGRSVERTPWEVPALRPAVLLFYKALGGRPTDRADYKQLHGRLDAPGPGMASRIDQRGSPGPSVTGTPRKDYPENSPGGL
jgi:hypothetical protein